MVKLRGQAGGKRIVELRKGVFFLHRPHLLLVRLCRLNIIVLQTFYQIKTLVRLDDIADFAVLQGPTEKCVCWLTS